MRKHFNRSKQGGFTFVELAISLVILGGAYILFAAVIIPKYQAWQAAVEATGASTATQVVKKQAPNGDFGTGSLGPAVSQEVKGNYTNIGTDAAPVFKNRYGGTFTVTGSGGTATLKDGGLPQVACKAVVMQISTDFNTDAQITAGSQSWPAASKITANEAAAACLASATDVTWIISAGM